MTSLPLKARPGPCSCMQGRPDHPDGLHWYRSRERMHALCYYRIRRPDAPKTPALCMALQVPKAAGALPAPLRPQATAKQAVAVLDTSTVDSTWYPEICSDTRRRKRKEVSGADIRVHTTGRDSTGQETDFASDCNLGRRFWVRYRTSFSA